jgi:uncharacterized membrane protein YoaK (UPF0700 family)
MTDAGDRYETVGFLDLCLALLSLASGITDATAFLQLGTVFTSAIVMSLTNSLLRRADDGTIPFTTKRQIGILLVYGLGAVLAGALISANLGLYIWLPVIAVAGASASYEFGRESAP